MFPPAPKQPTIPMPLKLPKPIPLLPPPHLQLRPPVKLIVKFPKTQLLLLLSLSDYRLRQLLVIDKMVDFVTVSRQDFDPDEIN